MTATLTLRGYQEDALDAVARAESRGIRKQLIVAATGLGKAQPIDEPVLTPTGWKPIGDLGVGDLVIGSDGLPTEVTGVFPQGVRPVVAVRFSDGARVRCDPDHLWAVRDKHDVYRGRPWRVMKTSDLGDRRWRVPLVAPVQMDGLALPLDPYLLGVLLGDGGLSVKGRVLLHTEHELAESLDVPAPAEISFIGALGSGEKAGTYIVGGPTGRSRNPVLSALRMMGLEGATSKTKRVPWFYLNAGADDRLELLRGIMDADGHARRDGHVEITLANEGLIDDVAALVRSLGGTARKRWKRTSWVSRGEPRSGEAWRLSIAMTVCPFRWKADRWRPRTKYTPARFIESVEPAGEAESVCISVSAPDQLYVTTDYVVTHNTVMFVELARRRGGRALILVHRDELVNQAVEKVESLWPNVSVGIVKAARNDVAHHVVVASVQTLSREARLDQLRAAYDGSSLLRADPFGLVVIDEAHHAAADSYRAVIAGLDAGEEGPLLVGVTATPDRGDGLGLDGVFGEIVSNHDMLWGIQARYLAELRGLAVQAEFDLADVKVRRGDYDQGQAGRIMEEAGTPALVVSAWKQHAPGRRTIVFTPTVEMAAHTAEAFTDAGISAAHVSGSTPIDERRLILERFETGKIDVVANCAVLTEGYDNPRVDCIVVARPTKSRALYTQMVGRGTRRHPDKTDCLVIDVVGASEDHSLVTVPSLFGVSDPRRRRAMSDGTGDVSELVIEDRVEKAKIDRVAAAEVDLFRRIRSEGIAWVRVEDPRGKNLTRYLRSLGTDRAGRRRPTVAISRVAPTVECRTWTAVLVHADRTVEPLTTDVPLETAQGIAEDWIRANGGVGALVQADAPWRRRRPTPKQLVAARRWRLPIDPAWTAGDLSDALDAHIARIQNRRTHP